jgi:hypothetical protein
VDLVDIILVVWVVHAIASIDEALFLLCVKWLASVLASHWAVEFFKCQIKPSMSYRIGIQIICMMYTAIGIQFSTSVF